MKMTKKEKTPNAISKSKPSQVIKKYYSQDDQEKIAKMGYKIIDIVCDAQLSHAVMALGLAQEYLECKVDEAK
jgi:hypothetical protein